MRPKPMSGSDYAASSVESSTEEITEQGLAEKKPVSSPRPSSITKDILENAENATQLPDPPP